MKITALMIPLSLWGGVLWPIAAPLSLLIAAQYPASPNSPAKSAAFTRQDAPQDVPLERGGPARHALLIGVSGYSHGKTDAKYGDLNTQPDIWAMKRTLMTRFGFKNNEIMVLIKPEETTHQAIVTAFQKFLLQDTKAGDVVYFHYSGHGSQLPASKGSNRPGGTIQTLVPSDWKDPASLDDPAKALKDSNEISDTELAALLQTLKDKNKPGSVTLSFDCCHSGLLTNGVRGAARMLVRTRNPNAPGSKSLDAALAKAARESFSAVPPTAQVGPQGRERSAGTRGGNLPILGDSTGKQLGFVTFSACRYDQTDKETMDDSSKPMGSLTYFLCKAFNEAKPDTTVRDVFERINGLMTTTLEDQNPVMDGDTNNLLLKGVALPAEPYLPTRLSKGENSESLVLEAGTVLGVSKGSVYDLYAPGTKKFDDKSKVVASATVVSVGLNESVLRITTPGMTPAKADASRAVETSHAYEDNRLKVDVSALKETPEGQKVLAALQKYDSKTGLVDMSNTPGKAPQVRILPSGSRELTANSSRGAVPPQASYVFLRANDGDAFQNVSASAQSDKDAEAIFAALLRESKAQFVRTMTNPDQAASNITIEMTLVPCEVDNPDRQDAKFVKFKGDPNAKVSGKDTIFTAGSDWVAIRLKNTGRVKTHYSILDIDPTGRISGLWPRRGDNNEIEPGQEVYLSSGSQIIPIHLTEPVGKEMIKIIATPDNTDLSALFSPSEKTRGGARGGNSPISKLLLMTSEGKRAGIAAPPESWATAEASFIVVPKK